MGCSFYCYTSMEWPVMKLRPLVDTLIGELTLDNLEKYRIPKGINVTSNTGSFRFPGKICEPSI